MSPKVLLSLLALSLLLLFGIPTRYVSETFINHDSLSTQIPVALVAVEQSKNSITEKIDLEVDFDGSWQEIHSIDLVFFSSQTSPVAYEASLKSPDGCKFSAVKPFFSIENFLRFRHPDLSTITFQPDNVVKCGPESKTFTLSIVRSAHEKIGLWAHHGKISKSGFSIRIIDSDKSMPIEAKQSVLMGRVLKKKSSENTVSDIFGKTVQAGPPLWVFLSLLALIILILCLKERRLTSAPVILVCVIIFISALTIFLIPPFQNADEPDHYLSLVDTINAERALLSAQNADFERIKFRFLESNFSPEAPKSISSWSEHIRPIEDYGFRSPLTFAYYELMKPLLTDVYSARILSLIFLCILIIGMIFFGWHLQVNSTVIILAVAWSVFCVPIFYYSSYVSNYGFLSALSYHYAIIIFFIMLSPERSEDSFGAGVYASLSAMAVFASSINGFSIYLLHFFLTCALLSYRRKSLSYSKNKIGLFHFGSLIGTILASTAIPYFISDHKVVSAFSSSVSQTAGLRLSEIAASSPISFKLIRGVIFILPLAIAVIADKIGNKIYTKRSFKFFNFPFFLTILIAVLISFKILSDDFKMPFISQGLRPEMMSSQTGMHAFQYVVVSITQFVTALFGGVPNFMVVQSFWGGFGWLDMSLPQDLVKLIMIGSTCGVLCIHILPISRGIRSPLFMTSSVILFFCIAVGIICGNAIIFGMDVVGRYLLMPYIIFFTLSWMSLFYVAHRNRSPLLIAFIFILVSLPITAILTILDRYYLILGGRM